MNFKNIWTFDMENSINSYWKTHLSDIKLLSIIFLINLFIFGQKIFYTSMPADDYMRFYGDDNTRLLITNSARWAQALLNNYVFSGMLQIMPYLHGLLGILSFSIMGLLTGKYFKRTDKIEIIFIALLVSATPMFAHNLFFSTNISAWITLLFGLIGFIISYYKNLFLKVLGFVLLVFSIGNYQTIVQVLLIMIVFKFIIALLSVKNILELKLHFFEALKKILFIFLAYIVSYSINEWFLTIHHWHVEHRLAKSTISIGFFGYWERMKSIYTDFMTFRYFQTQFYSLYGVIAIGSFVISIFAIAKRKIDRKLKFFTLFLLIFCFTSIPLLINLPLLMGVDIPPRAYFQVGWMLAGFFVLQMILYKDFMRSISLLVSFLIIILSAYYISLFFDAGIRQTNADMRRANLIVQRIRMNKNYIQEPIQFKIEGGRKFNVLGWDLKFEQPFSTHWAKYKLFKYFTDFNFQKMSVSDWNKIKQHLIVKGEMIFDYPGKNSVVVYGNKAVIFLDSSRINMLIHKKKYIKKFKDKIPDKKSVYNIYIENHILFYKKENCHNGDMSHEFFLRIYPNQSKRNDDASHQTMDFYFGERGIKKNGTCIAAVPLPKLDKYRIYTGQFQRGKNIFWEENLYLPLENNLKNIK